jgi:hypothetical protein
MIFLFLWIIVLIIFAIEHIQCTNIADSKCVCDLDPEILIRICFTARYFFWVRDLDPEN